MKEADGREPMVLTNDGVAILGKGLLTIASDGKVGIRSWDE